MRGCLLPVAVWLLAAGPVLAVCDTVACDFGLPGDLDDDGDVDPGDFILFRQCETDARATAGIACGWADLNRDGLVDADDFAIWQSHYTGPCSCEPILKEPRTQPLAPEPDPRMRMVQALQDASPPGDDAGGPVAAVRSAGELSWPYLPDPVWLSRRHDSVDDLHAALPDTGPLPDLHAWPRVPDESWLRPSGPHVGDPNPMYRVHGHSGEFHLEVTDLRVAGRGMDLEWKRTYRSRTGRLTAAGHNWDYSYNIRIEPVGEHMRLYDGHGRVDTLLRRPDGTWARQELFAVLELDGRTPVLSWADGTRWVMRPLDDLQAPGRIDRMVDRNGNTISFSYDLRGRLITVHGTLERGGSQHRDLTITYNADGFIEAVTDFTGRRVTYQYYDDTSSDGSRGDLRSVTGPAVTGTVTGNDFPAGKTVTYTYSRGESDERLNHNLLTITNGRGQTWLRNVYGRFGDDAEGLTFDRVIQQSYGEPGERIHTVYQTISPSAINNFAVITATVNDRVGNVSVYYYDSRNRLVLRRQYTGRAEADQPTNLDLQQNLPGPPLRLSDPPYFETRWEYNDDALCTRMVTAERSQELFVYDSANSDPRARGNLLERTRRPGPAGGEQAELVETFTYEPGINRVSRYIDACGHETRYGYDEAGNCTRIQYPIGSITEYFEYNAYGQLTAHLWPDSGAEVRRRDEFVYYGAGAQRGFLQECILDADGAALRVTYEYDALGRVTQVRTPRGLDSLYFWNALDQLVRRTSPEILPGSNARSYCDYYYDAADNLVQIQQGGWGEAFEGPDAASMTTTLEYDILNCVLRSTRIGSAGASITLEYAYDGNRNRVLTRYGEAAAGRQPANTLTTLYDERDLPFRRIRAAGDPLQSSIQYDYDGQGRLRRLAEGLESLTPQVTRFWHDGYGRLVRRMDAMGNEERCAYDPAGNLVSRRIDGELQDGPGSESNVRLAETLYEYDEMHRLTRRIEKFFDPHTQSAVDDGEAVTRFEYTDMGGVQRRIDDLGQALHFEYDSLGRRVRVRDERGNATAFAHDPHSNVISVTQTARSDLGNPDATWTHSFEYDGLDRVIRRVEASDATTRYTWDALGHCTLVVDARGHATRHVHDGLGRQVAMIIDMDGNGPDAADAADIAVSQRWDDSSRLISQTDSNLNTTTYVYDALNRLVETRYADGTTQTITYDVFGRPIALTDPVGTTVRSTYDLLNRVVSRSIARGQGISGVTRESYAYDGLSRLVAGSDDDSEITLQYDSLGNLVRETQVVLPGGSVSTVTATYDSLGRRLTLTYPGGRHIAMTYDSLGRAVAVRDETPVPGTSTLIAAYSYLGPDRIERRDFGNGVRLDLSYGPHGRVEALRYTTIGGSGLLTDRMYRWDQVGNRTQVESSVEARTTLHEYDAANRLVQTQRLPGPLTVTYALDGVSNRTSVSGGREAGPYLLDPATPEPADFQMNQYTVIPGQPRTYDRAGNLITAGSACRYSYDYRGQLTELTDLSAALTVLYKYDVLGRRIEKNAGGIITRSYYAGCDEIEEQNASNITLATFVHAPPRPGQRGFIEAGPLQLARGRQRMFRLTDDLGTCLMLTDGTGAVLEQYDYTSFGYPTFMDATGASLDSSVAGNLFLMRGLRFEMESGFYLVAPPVTRSAAPQVHDLLASPAMTSRAYDPATGRFITRLGPARWPLRAFGNARDAWNHNPVSP